MTYLSLEEAIALQKAGVDIYFKSMSGKEMRLWWDIGTHRASGYEYYIK